VEVREQVEQVRVQRTCARERMACSYRIESVHARDVGAWCVCGRSGSESESESESDERKSGNEKLERGVEVGSRDEEGVGVLDMRGYDVGKNRSGSGVVWSESDNYEVMVTEWNPEREG